MSPALPRLITETPTAMGRQRPNQLRVPPVRMRWDSEDMVHVLDAQGVRRLSATFSRMCTDIHVVGIMGSTKDLRSDGGDRASASALIVAAGYVLSANPHIALPKAKYMGTRWRVKRGPAVLAVYANRYGNHIATPLCVYKTPGAWQADIAMLVDGKRRTFVAYEHSMTMATLLAVACLVSAI